MKKYKLVRKTILVRRPIRTKRTKKKVKITREVKYTPETPLQKTGAVVRVIGKGLMIGAENFKQNWDASRSRSGYKY